MSGPKDHDALYLENMYVYINLNYKEVSYLESPS